jgi:DNA polymerase-3 subunit gamma/tau
MAEVAGRFSEEDLTRFLQITLDVFKDLQTSLQPRLHLELGLLKLVQSGRLTAIEEALALLDPGSAAPKAGPPRPPTPPVLTPTPTPRSFAPAPLPAAPPAITPPQPAAPPPVSGGLRERMHAAAVEAGMTFTADAIEVSNIQEDATMVEITAPEESQLSLKEKELQQLLSRVGVQKRVKLKFQAGVVAAPSDRPAQRSNQEAELTERALSHPMVKRFQEWFPDSQVRQVRNLKE